MVSDHDSDPVFDSDSVSLMGKFIEEIRRVNAGLARFTKSVNTWAMPERNPEVRARLRELQSQREYRLRIAEERRKGQAYVKAEAARIRRELGLDD